MRRFLVGAALLAAVVSLPAQQMVTETRDPAQTQDEDFAKSVKEWTTEPYYSSPLVDHLPKVAGIPSPKDVLGYHIGAPYKITYYADILNTTARWPPRPLASRWRRSAARTKIANSSSCGCRRTTTCGTSRRTGTISRRLQTRVASRKHKSRISSRRPDRSIT